MEDIKVNVASNLIKLRTAAGLTQMELGQKINYSDKAVSKWERAESLPDVAVLKSIADIFGVTVDYLINPHDEWEHTPVKTKELQYRPNAIISVVLLSMISVVTLIFIIFWLLEKMLWQIFVYALPAVLLVAFILSLVWKKNKVTFYILSALMVSIVGVIYTAISQAGGNPWQLFLLCIPLELIIIFSHLVKKKNKEK